MRGILATPTTPRYLWTAAAGKVRHQAGWGPGGILRLVDDLADPRLPDAPGWVRVRPELSGVCGSDLGLAHAKISFVLSAFYRSERIIPGHEMVAVVSEVGPGVTGVAEGDRVVVNPVMSCVQRGFDPMCTTCAAGHPHLCERLDQPGVVDCSAPAAGFAEVVGGGWGQQVIAHESQLHRIGDIPSRRAVLAEPASIGLHAALRWQRSGDRAVVIGPGTIGLLVTAALRMLHPDLDIAMVSPGDFGSERALRAGANRILPSGPQAVEELARADGGRVLRPRMTKIPILDRGVDVVFDCVASPDTLELATHILRPRGTVILIGAAGKQTADWSLVWHRELSVLGSVFYGPEPHLGTTTFDRVVEWLPERAYRIDDMVTHTYDLGDWTQALDTASAGPRARAVKVTLRPNPDIPLVG